MEQEQYSRRNFLTKSAAAAGALALGGSLLELLTGCSGVEPEATISVDYAVSPRSMPSTTAPTATFTVSPIPSPTPSTTLVPPSPTPFSSPTATPCGPPNIQMNVNQDTPLEELVQRYGSGGWNIAITRAEYGCGGLGFRWLFPGQQPVVGSSVHVDPVEPGPLEGQLQVLNHMGEVLSTVPVVRLVAYGAAAIPEMRYGVEAFFNDPRFFSELYTAHRMQQAFELLSQLPIHVVRTRVPWRVLEPAEGNYDFSVIDNIAQNLDPAVRIMGTVIWPPDDLIPPGSNPRSQWGLPLPTDLDRLNRFLVQLATRYGNRMIYEIFNEIEVPAECPSCDFFEYMDLLRAARLAVKYGCPDAMVVHGGFTFNGVTTYQFAPRLRDFLSRDGGTLTDAINIHQNFPFYEDGDVVTRFFDHLRETTDCMSQYDVELPLMCSETGCPSQDPEGRNRTSLERQAELLRVILSDERSRHVTLIWYRFEQYTRITEDWFSTYGIVTEDMVAKPAYNAFASLGG